MNNKLTILSFLLVVLTLSAAGNMFAPQALAIVPLRLTTPATELKDLPVLCWQSHVENWQHDTDNSFNGSTGEDIHAAWLLAWLHQDHFTNRNFSYDGVREPSKVVMSTSQLLDFAISKNHVRDSSLDLAFEKALKQFVAPAKWATGAAIAQWPCGADFQCRRAVKKGVFVTSPSQFFARGYVSFPESVREMRDDPLYSRAAAILVKKFFSEQPLVGLQEEEAAKNTRVTGNLYSDTFSAFQTLGVATARIPHYAITLLSLYGMRGTNTGVFRTIPFRYLDDAPTVFELMQVIGLQINYFDHLNDQQKKPFYSLPTEIQNHCFYDRPYHFWMAAALTEQLLEKGFAPADAARAAHELGVFYEKRGGVSKKANRVFIDEVYRTETSKNIAFDDAAATWVANGFKTVSADQLLLNILNSANTKSKSWSGRVGAEANMSLWAKPSPLKNSISLSGAAPIQKKDRHDVGFCE